MKWPFVIILSGPPAVGKNTIAQRLCDEFPLKTANLDLDRIKLVVPNAPSTDYFLDLASKVGQSMLRYYLQADMSVIVHKAFCSFDFVKPFIDISNSFGIEYEYFKLKATLEELLIRNRARNYYSKEEDLKRIYDIDKKYTHVKGIEIDTMANGIDGTVKIILDYIRVTK